MSNLHGYSDYNGPQCTTTTTTATAGANDDEHDDDDNPLQVGFWMEGDSLAPPCGTSITTIHQILDFARVDADDVLYDLGCGDGRVCLEAYAKRHCRSTIGIEVEEDLVQRANELIGRLPKTTNNQGQQQQQQQQDLPRVIQADLRVVLDTLIETVRQSHIGGESAVKNPNSSTIDSLEQQPLPLPTVIILYLLPEALAELVPRFQELLLELEECNSMLPSPARKLRIVCNTWGFPNWRPMLQKEIAEGGGGGNGVVTTSLFLYTNESLVSGNATVES